MWCRECINQNEGKCPNKCKKCEFIKPHRILRQIIKEIYVECEACKQNIKNLDYENHKGSKTCKISQNQKQNGYAKLFKYEPLKKIIKKNSIQNLNQNQEQKNIFQEEQNTDDSQSNALTQSTLKGELFNNNLQENYQQNEEQECLSKIFDSGDDDGGVEQKIVKQEKQICHKQNHIEAYAKQQNNNFKVMNISLYKHGQWQPLEEGINAEINFQVLKYLAENCDNTLKEMSIKIKNTFYDFSKFEVYEQYNQINIDCDTEDYNYNSDNDSSTQQYYRIGVEKRKLIGKFKIYDNQEDFKERVKVYFLHENDAIYYHEQDQQNILEQFQKNPNSTSIRTVRSQVNLAKMAEFTEKKVRDIKFELVF
ncbi:hypothetical protein ABPG72_008101 [Tetrahymena utriculariae]